MNSFPWFSATAMSLIDDQVNRKTSASMVAMQQLPDGGGLLQSASLDDAHIWHAEERPGLAARIGRAVSAGLRDLREQVSIAWCRLTFQGDCARQHA